jgi:hypothetical protein
MTRCTTDYQFNRKESGLDMIPYTLKEYGTKIKEGREKVLSQILESFADTGQIERLIVFCNWCVYEMYKSSLLQTDCSLCGVHHAKRRMLMRIAAETDAVRSSQQGRVRC